jgi:hypothetical protein
LPCVAHNHTALIAHLSQFAAVLLVIVSAHCGNLTSSIEVSPPPTEAHLPAEALDPLDSSVELGAPDAKRHIVSGIGRDEQTGQWRAQSGATLRFLTLPLDEIRFGLNVNLPPELVTPSKPVVLRVSLNGQHFIEQTFNTAGPHSIDEAVPKGLVTWEHETLVAIFIEPPPGRPIERPILQIISAGFRP